MKPSLLALLRTAVFALSCTLALSGYALRIVDNLSPHNDELPFRTSTDLIILHTTEGDDLSSLNSVKSNGTCNYLVMMDGTVHRIVNCDRVANHAGLSMWNGASETYKGKNSVSPFSIGIEVVGYHDQMPNMAQLLSLKELLSDLRSIYKLSDDQVLTHSMVAYGAPNRYHNYEHRGRKRCGMLFADQSVRASIGLFSAPTEDPDVKACRLKNGDSELCQRLYGSTKPKDEPSMADDDVVPSTDFLLQMSSGVEETPSTLANEVVLRTIPGDGKNAWTIAGNKYASVTTIYILPDGRIRSGTQLTKYELDHLPDNTSILLDYVYRGVVSVERNVYALAGERWNKSTTLYLCDGNMWTGDRIDDGLGIRPGTVVLFPR